MFFSGLESNTTNKRPSRKLTNFLQDRDKLKFKTMAKYKAITNGDILSYEHIDQGLLRRPSIRALALEDTSIEDFER